LNLTADRSCEVDLVVIQHGEQSLRQSDATLRGMFEIGVGECKDEGGWIDGKDIENLLWLREKFEHKHMHCVLIFAKCADAFEEEELRQFRELANRHVPMILFTNRELEPYDPYEMYREVELPERHPFTLDEMATNSRFIYLR